MKITFNSPLILSFSFLCLVIYIMTAYLNIFENSFILQPTWGSGGLLSYFRLFSHTLGHSNLEHLIGNLSFILLIGPIIEKQYGAKLVLLMMFTTALVTSILHILFFDNGLMGASGIVFMFIILTSMVNLKNKEIPLTFILVVIIFIGKELLGTFENDNISHFAHIIGGLVGAFFGFLLARKKTSAAPKGKDILTGL
jgi:membrane associated rhomboid family serine protease